VTFLCWWLVISICPIILLKHDIIHKTGSTQRIAPSPWEDQATDTGDRKFREAWIHDFWDMPTDIYTDVHTHIDIQTYTHTDHNSLHPPWSKVITDLCVCVQLMINNGRLHTAAINVLRHPLLPYPDTDAKYCYQHVCMSTFLSVWSHISKTTRPNFTNFSVHVIFWQQCNKLCTSGFVDDFHILELIGQNHRWHLFVQFARWQTRGKVYHLWLHLVKKCTNCYKNEPVY